MADKHRVHLRCADAKLGKLSCRAVTDVDQDVLATRDQQVGRLRTRGTGYRTGNRAQRHPATGFKSLGLLGRWRAVVIRLGHGAGQRHRADQSQIKKTHRDNPNQKLKRARTP